MKSFKRNDIPIRLGSIHCVQVQYQSRMLLSSISLAATLRIDSSAQSLCNSNIRLLPPLPSSAPFLLSTNSSTLKFVCLPTSKRVSEWQRKNEKAEKNVSEIIFDEISNF